MERLLGAAAGSDAVAEEEAPNGPPIDRQVLVLTVDLLSDEEPLAVLSRAFTDALQD